MDVGVRRCRQMSSEWQAVGRFQRSSNRRERYKYYQRPSASQGSFLYTEYPRRAVTIINRRPAVTYSMRFMKRLTCARQQEVVALAPRIYWRFEFSSIRRYLHISFWRAFSLYLTSAADLNSLVLLPGGLLWMPY